MESLPSASHPPAALPATEIGDIFTTNLLKAVHFYARQVWRSGCGRTRPITITSGRVALQLRALEVTANGVRLGTPRLAAAHVALAQAGAIVAAWPGVLRISADAALVIEIVEALPLQPGFMPGANVQRAAWAEAVAPLP